MMPGVVAAVPPAAASAGLPRNAIGAAASPSGRDSAQLLPRRAPASSVLRVTTRKTPALSVPIPDIPPRYVSGRETGHNQSRTNSGSGSGGRGTGGHGHGHGGGGGDGDGSTNGGNSGGAGPSAGVAVLAALSDPRVGRDAFLCALTFAVADLTAQATSVDWREALLGQFDFSRTLRLVCFGLLFKGPIMSMFYKAMDSKLPGSTSRRVMTKLLVDQTAWSWFNNAAFLFAMPVMEGRSVSEAAAIVKTQFPTLQKNAYMLWPAAHFVNFTWVPPAGRTMYISAISLVWAGMCCISARSQ